MAMTIENNIERCLKKFGTTVSNTGSPKTAHWSPNGFRRARSLPEPERADLSGEAAPKTRPSQHGAKAASVSRPTRRAKVSAGA